MAMSFSEEVRLAEEMAEEFGLRKVQVEPGRDTAAAIGRIRTWLEQFPDGVSVAGQIGISDKYRSPGWPYRMYAVDRRDLLAALDAAEEGMKKQ